MMNAPLPDLRGQQWTEPVPPEPHRLMADIYAAFEQQILNLSQRKRIPHVHHHREANHLRGTVEVTEGILHRCKLRNAPARLKPIYSDTALPRTSSGKSHSCETPMTRSPSPSAKQISVELGNKETIRCGTAIMNPPSSPGLGPMMIHKIQNHRAGAFQAEPRGAFLDAAGQRHGTFCAMGLGCRRRGYSERDCS